MSRAVIYCRISNDPTGKAAGVRRQEDDCRALAARMGLEVVAVFVDNDVSAYAKTRPHWEAMLRLIEADGIETLICWHTDRLYRRPRDLERLLDLLDDGALPGMVRTVTAGDFDLSTPAGRAMARTLVAWSNAEVEQMRLRMTRAKRQKAADGLPGGGRRPFGYEDDKLTIREGEAALIRDAVARITAGESLRAMADEWNRLEVPTRDGGPWRQQTIRNIVCNPRIAGLRTYKGEVIGDAAWPPIISHGEHKRMVAALKDPSRKRRGRYPDGRRFWLAGLLYCGRCGFRMWSSTAANPSLTVYRCPSKAYDKEACGGVAVTADRIEQHIAGLLYDRLAASRLPDLNPAVDGTRRAELQASLDEASNRLTEIGEAIGRGDLGITAGMAAERTVQADVHRLDADLRRATISTLGLPPGLTTDRWEKLTGDEMKQVAGVFLTRINVNPAEHGGTFNPARLQITWADQRA